MKTFRYVRLTLAILVAFMLALPVSATETNLSAARSIDTTFDLDFAESTNWTIDFDNEAGWFHFNHKYVDVFYHLGELIKELVDGKVTAEQIEAFCSGVTIFTRDDLTDGACDIVCGDERELQSTLRSLLYAGSDISAEQFQQLSAPELESLAELCFELGDCCDRGKADLTLAHFISVQEFGSDEYLEELQATNDLLARFTDMIPAR